MVCRTDRFGSTDLAFRAFTSAVDKREFLSDEEKEEWRFIALIDDDLNVLRFRR